MLLLIKLLKNAYPSEQVMKLLIKDVKRERMGREVLPHNVLCAIIVLRWLAMVAIRFNPA